MLQQSSLASDAAATRHAHAPTQHARRCARACVRDDFIEVTRHFAHFDRLLVGQWRLHGLGDAPAAGRCAALREAQLAQQRRHGEQR
jgi:hypothetical protein